MTLQPTRWFAWMGDPAALATDGHFGAGAEDTPVQAVLVQAAQRLDRGALARLELRDDLVAVVG